MTIRLDEQDLAWVESENKIYFAVYPRAVQSPSSSVVKLLQGIFDTFKDHSFFILRKSVFTTAPENEMDRSMVKLVAKKISFNEVEASQKILEKISAPSDSITEIGKTHELLYDCQLLNRQNKEIDLATLPADPQAAVTSLVSQIPRGEVLHDYDRPIAAVMKSKEGQWLSAGAHSASINKTLHAEVNLVQAWFRKSGQKIPFDAHIHVSHKPCRMCASMIRQWAEDPRRLQVTWDEDVTGRHSRHPWFSSADNL